MDTQRVSTRNFADDDGRNVGCMRYDVRTASLHSEAVDCRVRFP